MRSEHPRTPWLGVCHRVLCACGSGSAGSVCPEFRQPGRKTWVLTNLQSLQNEVKTFRETEETSGSGSQQKCLSGIISNWQTQFCFNSRDKSSVNSLGLKFFPA